MRRTLLKHLLLMLVASLCLSLAIRVVAFVTEWSELLLLLKQLRERSVPCALVVHDHEARLVERGGSCERLLRFRRLGTEAGDIGFYVCDVSLLFLIGRLLRGQSFGSCKFEGGVVSGI